MGYQVTSYADRVQLGKAFAASMIAEGAVIKREYEHTVNNEQAYDVIVQVSTDVFVHYSFQRYRWYSRRGTQYFAEAIFTKMGTAYSEGADTVSGLVSSNLGSNSATNSSANNHQNVPIPGKLHVARNDTTSEFMFALESSVDGLTTCHGVGRIQIKDLDFGYSTQWFFDGEYIYRDANTNARIPFFNNVDGTGRARQQAGVMQSRNVNGAVTGYEKMGQRSLSYSPDTTSAFQPLGYQGFYNTIQSKISFEPSLTSVFLSALWMASKGLNQNLRTPRADRESFKICNMKYLGVGQKVVYSNQEWRVFPTRGKGSTDTAGIAFHVGEA